VPKNLINTRFFALDGVSAILQNHTYP